MNILLVNYEFPPIGGGGSKASFELARRLVRRGHAVTVLTSRFGGMDSRERLEGIDVHRVWSWRKSIHDCGLRGAATFLLAALPRLRRLLKSGEFDVVHYFFGLPTGALAYYSHGVAGLPYIVSLRGSDVPLYDLDSPRLRWLHRVTAPVTRSIWTNARYVTAVSRGLRDLAIESVPGIDDIVVIYNGVEFPRSTENTNDDAGAQRDFRINCVARLIPRKGVGDLLKAASIVSDPRLEIHIIGTGPALESLQRQARDLGISEQCLFHGYCDRNEVDRLNSQADLFVLPTYSEAFANVILEAMSAELPVIATNVGGIPEAVLDGETGILVEPGQPRAIADAISTLLKNDGQRRQMGRCGRERIAEHFSWEANADQFERILASSAAPAR